MSLQLPDHLAGHCLLDGGAHEAHHRGVYPPAKQPRHTGAGHLLQLELSDETDEGAPPWIPYHRELTEGLAALVGARPDEVVAMNSLTANLHLMMVSFYRPSGDRNRIVTLSRSFSSDRYAVDSQIRYHGLDPAECRVDLAPRPGETTLRQEDIEATLQEGVLCTRQQSRGAR